MIHVVSSIHCPDKEDEHPTHLIDQSPRGFVYIQCFGALQLRKGTIYTGNTFQLTDKQAEFGEIV